MNYDWVEVNKDIFFFFCVCYLDYGKYCYWFLVYVFDFKMLIKDYIISF